MKLGCVATYTGKLVDIRSPKVEMICIEDIAHHLSLENRWGGATRDPWSVAAHSLLVGAVSEKIHNGSFIHGLMHDAHEAYVKDVQTPWKRCLHYQDLNDKRTLFEEACSRLDDVIYEALGLDPINDDQLNAVAKADSWMAGLEAKHLVEPCPEAERHDPRVPEWAEQTFIQKFHRWKDRSFTAKDFEKFFLESFRAS